VISDLLLLRARSGMDLRARLRARSPCQLGRARRAPNERGAQMRRSLVGECYAKQGGRCWRHAGVRSCTAVGGADDF